MGDDTKETLAGHKKKQLLKMTPEREANQNQKKKIRNMFMNIATNLLYICTSLCMFFIYVNM